MVIILADFYGVEVRELLSGERTAPQAIPLPQEKLRETLHEYHVHKEAPALRVLRQNRQNLLQACFKLCLTQYSFTLFYCWEHGMLSANTVSHPGFFYTFLFPLVYLVFLLISDHFRQQWQYTEANVYRKTGLAILLAGDLWGLFVLLSAALTEVVNVDYYDIYVYPLGSMLLCTTVGVLYFRCAANVIAENKLIQSD